MATHTIYVPGTDWMSKFCRNIFFKKIWLSRKNCDCLEIKIKLVCPKLTYLLNESEMKRNKGKKENYCVVTLTRIRLNFRWLEADFAGALIMNPDCGVMIDLWKSRILYRSSCVFATLLCVLFMCIIFLF